MNFTKIETITLNQLTATLRDYGMKITEPVLADYIMEGKLPFATGIDRNGTRHFMIFKRQALKIDEREKNNIELLREAAMTAQEAI